MTTDMGGSTPPRERGVFLMNIQAYRVEPTHWADDLSCVFMTDRQYDEYRKAMIAYFEWQERIKGMVEASKHMTDIKQRRIEHK